MTPVTGATRFFARQERFGRITSTNDVVREWLRDGEPEVSVAVADEQTAGRGRAGRAWLAPPGAALLLSLGFRPHWIAPDRAWRIPATAMLAMADAAEEAAGLEDRAIRIKWPNDLVVATAGPDALLSPELDVTEMTRRRAAPIELRKLGGVLSEADGLGTDDPRLVVGIGVNADWPEAAFPADLARTMTSLREASHGRPVDLVRLLDAFLLRLEPRIEALRGGWFDVADWTARQATTGHDVRVELPGEVLAARALGVDAHSGGLVLADPVEPGRERTVLVGEVVRVRLAEVRV